MSDDGEIVELEVVRREAPPPAPPPLPLPTAYPAQQTRTSERRTGPKSEREARDERRPMRKPVSGVVIAVGGVAGIALGLVVLWLVFQRDPLGLFGSRRTREVASADRFAPRRDRWPRPDATDTRHPPSPTPPSLDRSRIPPPNPAIPGGPPPGVEVKISPTGTPYWTPPPPGVSPIQPPSSVVEQAPPRRPAAPPPRGQRPSRQGVAQNERAAPPGQDSGDPTFAELLSGDAEPAAEPESEPSTKLAQIPSDEDRLAATQRMNETFRDELAGAEDSETKGDLAATLIARGDELLDDQATRYVFLEKAYRLAVESGDLVLAQQAVDGLASSFEVDGLAMRTRAIATIAKEARTDVLRRELAVTAIRLAIEATTVGRFNEATVLVEIPEPLAQRLRDVNLIAQAKSLREAVDLRSKRAVEIESTRAALEANPDDANLAETYGRFLCLQNDDWEAGLPLLAKSEDPQLREAAARDMVEPQGATDLIAVANAWFVVAERGDEYAGFFRRSAGRYSQALAQARGLDRIRVEKRLEEIAGQPSTQADGLAELAPDVARNSPVVFAPSRDDLWDVGQGTKIVENTPVLKDADIRSMLGGAVSRTPFGPDVMFFAEAPGETVHAAEWKTDRYVTIRRLVMNLRCDPRKPDHGRASAIRIHAWSVKENRFEEILNLPTFSSSYLPSRMSNGWSLDPNAERGVVALNAPIPPVTANRFRAEFVQAGGLDEAYLGPLVVELDAYSE